MLTIRGDAERRSNGSIALVTRITPITLVSRASRTVSGSTLVGSCGTPPVIAALLTSTSSRPARSSIRTAAAATLASSVTSSGTPKASTPAARSFATASSRRCSSRAPTPTLQPRAPNPAAISYPIPLFAPVTSAVVVRSVVRSVMLPSWARRPGDLQHRSGGRRYPAGIDPGGAGYRGGVETRELRYFVTVAEELHFGRAAQRLGMAQPPLSPATSQPERRLGAVLLERTSRAVCLTEAGAVLLREARAARDAVEAAERRTRRAALAATGHSGMVLASKAGATDELLAKLLDAYAAEPGAVTVEVLLCGIGEQGRLLRDGRADVALLHRPFDAMAGLDVE